jgi:NSS family neurotransmitter:Na+ symporter
MAEIAARRRVSSVYQAGELALNMETGSTKDRFSTKLGVLVATLGSAVGLGNIWKFPYLTGANGGAAFVIIYILCTFAVGLPVMIAEQVLGRTARADAVKTMKKLAPGSAWWLTGLAGVTSAFLIMAFYTEVAGWVFAYIVRSITGAVLSSDPAVTSKAFGDLVSDPVQSLVWQWIVLIVVGGVIWAGVSHGIEKVTKRLMPVLFGILIIVCVRSITLPNAAKGLQFLFTPDFSKVTTATVLTALGLAFFKLSVGMGAMTTYGSYYHDDQNIPSTAVRVMFSDLLVSMLAGIAIFPAVFSFGFEPGSGAGLLFATIPAVFSSMPLGQVLMPLFFVLAAIAALGAMLSLYEVPVAYLVGSLGWNRKRATLATFVGLAVVGFTAALSNSTMAGVKPFGLTPFDLFDYVTSNLLLPIAGLFTSLFIGWRWGMPKLRDALSNGGKLENQPVITVFSILARFVTPALVVIVLLNGLHII